MGNEELSYDPAAMYEPNTGRRDHVELYMNRAHVWAQRKRRAIRGPKCLIYEPNVHKMTARCRCINDIIPDGGACEGPTERTRADLMHDPNVRIMTARAR